MLPSCEFRDEIELTFTENEDFPTSGENRRPQHNEDKKPNEFASRRKPPRTSSPLKALQCYHAAAAPVDSQKRGSGGGGPQKVFSEPSDQPSLALARAPPGGPHRWLKSEDTVFF